jgi:hypothetical protein
VTSQARRRGDIRCAVRGTNVESTTRKGLIDCKKTRRYSRDGVSIVVLEDRYVRWLMNKSKIKTSLRAKECRIILISSSMCNCCKVDNDVHELRKEE